MTIIVEEIRLHHWVRSNEREAQGVIPELVGRLVAASVRQPNDIRFPRADGIGQSGEDGYLDTDTGFQPFVPEGKSFWEIGTGANPAAKANSDYSNRTGATPEATRQESVLVIVTPSSAVHAWTSDAQKTWRTEKLDRKEWRDVRVLDATLLIEWLSSFPAVERWLAIKMHLPADAIEIPEERWNELRRIGSPPPLPPRLFTANRTQACAKLDDVFRGTSGLLKIDTHFPTHMADLVAAHLAHMDDAIRHEIAGRCLIITRPDAWSTLTSLRDHHVFIADFDIDDTDTTGMRLIERAKLQGHAVVFAGKAGGVPHPNRVSIPEPTNHQVIEVLKEAGYNEERARNLAMKSTGSLSSLLRCLQNLSSIPEWAQRTEAAELRIAEMLGAWNENVEGDRQVAEELSGKAYGEWIGTIREIARRPASPLKQKNGIWKFVSRYEGWDALGPLIFKDDLNRFQELVVRIFRERAPSLELVPEERYMATIRGKTPNYSNLLRTGLAETLALLGSRPEVISNFSAAETTARVAVYESLKDADWQLWASLNDVLPLLAEAAPNEFLGAVERALQSTTFQAVFAQETRGFTGRTYMTGLLWALETLAWDSDYLSRVVLVLGELAAIDPGGNWANRPANSLWTIFLPWFPQTAASVDKRQAAVTALMSEQPNVAWDLILNLLPQMHQTSSMTRKPAWRKMIPDDWSEGSTNKDYWEQINSYAKLAVDEAKDDLPKLQTLIDKMNSLTPEARDELLRYLRSEPVKGLPQEKRLPIWKGLTDLIANHRRFQKADWAIKEEILETLSQIANELAPTSPSHRHQRLFIARDFDLYEETDNFEEEVRKLDARRRKAVEEIYGFGGLIAVLDFTRSVESPAHVGIAFAQFASVDDEKHILPELLESNDAALATFAGGFVWSKFRLADWDWVDAVDISTWTNSERAQLLAYLPFAPPTWNRAIALLGQEINLYWSKANVNPFDAEAEAEAEIGTAVDRLLEVGRVRESIFCISRQVFKKQPINAEQAIRALRAVAESYDQFGNMDAFEIVQIVKALQGDPTADPAAVASIEWSLLPLLDRTNSASPKFLERRLADEPAFFCEVIRTIFRSTKADEDSTNRTAQDPEIAKNAYRLLFEWRTPPGSCEDGSFDGTALKDWVAKVKASCEESGHLVVALQRALETAIESILLLPPRDLNQLPAALLILQGAKSLRDRAAATIGPRGGRTAYTGLRDGERVLTRDGLVIAQHLTSRDHHSREGIELLSKTAEEIRRQVGDGAKTALLLCYQMVNGGYEAIDSNEPLDEVLDGMERAVEKIVGYIDKSRKSPNDTDVFNIAKTAGGIAAAKLVDEAYKHAPSEGVWWVQDDVAPAASSVDVQSGIRFNGGYLADEFANDPSGDCVLENCFVLVYEGKLHSSHELAPIMGLVAEAKKPVFVLAEDVAGSALKLLVINNNKKLSCVAVKAPGYSQDKRNWLKDIAAITDTSVLGGMYGKKIETALFIRLGQGRKSFGAERCNSDLRRLRESETHEDKIGPTA